MGEGTRGGNRTGRDGGGYEKVWIRGEHMDIEGERQVEGGGMGWGGVGQGKGMEGRREE